MDEITQQARDVRRFNRFFTRQIGLLEQKYLRSPFSLIEARVIYELAQTQPTTATDLALVLNMDEAQLSRLLSKFGSKGLLDKTSSSNDGRQKLLNLTDIGQIAFSTLDQRSQVEIEKLLSPLSPDNRKVLLKAMSAIEDLLAPPDEPREPYILRPPRPGDMGWVVQWHGTLYASEYGWDETFEALVADIVAKYMQNHDPRRERCWIAERYNENIGSVFVVKKTETVAKLRLLLVEPSARGLGIGRRLVEECIRFARQAGYTRLTLWTNSVLTSARHIYANAGFRIVDQAPIHNFGHDLIEETWDLDL